METRVLQTPNTVYKDSKKFLHSEKFLFAYIRLARYARACYYVIYVKKLISLKHCVRSQITRLKLQKSFCDLEHGASL